MESHESVTCSDFYVLGTDETIDIYIPLRNRSCEIVFITENQNDKIDLCCEKFNLARCKSGEPEEMLLLHGPKTFTRLCEKMAQGLKTSDTIFLGASYWRFPGDSYG